MSDLFMYSGARFSDCGRYRFSLWRIWDKNKDCVAFIGLNPSTANATTDDPTIRRVIKFGADNGYGGIYMLNLFTLISPDPSYLKKSIISPDLLANFHLEHHSGYPIKDRVFCWGSFKEAKERANEVIKMFPNALCLGQNQDGSPKHPLYLKGNTKLIKFNNN